MASEQRIKAAMFLRPAGPRFRDLSTGKEHVIVVEQKKARFALLDGELFLPGSGVLLPARQAAADSKPDAIQILARALGHARDNSAAKILVAGHTSATGEASILPSMDRAAFTRGLLAGARQRFEGFEKNLFLDGQGRDRAAVLDWVSSRFGWSCGVTQGGDLSAATRAFQEDYNSGGKAGNSSAEDLAISGAFDGATWCAVFDCYRHQMAAALAVDLATLDTISGALTWVASSKPSVGCGGYRPQSNMDASLSWAGGDDRVEVLFFEAAQEPDVPCLAARCRPDACELFDSRWYEYTRIDASSKPREFKLQLHDRLFKPCPNTPCAVKLPSGDELQKTADGNGWIELTLPAGEQLLELTYCPPGEELKDTVEVRVGAAATTADSYYLQKLKNFGFTESASKMAIYRFQVEAGLALTGELNDETKSKISAICDGGDGSMAEILGRDNG